MRGGVVTEPDYVGVSEAARRLGVSRWTVRRWFHNGIALQGYTTPGGVIRISVTSLKQLIDYKRS